MRRAIFLLTAMGTALLLSSGVALALNVINCDSEEKCRGTEGPDLMKGTEGFDYMLGRGEEDTLKGFGRAEALLGQEGADTLLGGLGFDYLAGGRGDHRLRGEGRVDEYGFERSNWGQDTIVEDSPSKNAISLPNAEGFAGPVTTNLNSDSGPIAEVTNDQSGSTVNWDGNVIAFVLGSSGDDVVVTGNEVSNAIIDDADTDADNITGAEGNDFIVVQDGDTNDIVDCGLGNDTVYFDEGEVPINCEEENPQEPGLAAREAVADGAGVLQGAPPLFSGDHRPQ